MTDLVLEYETEKAISITDCADVADENEQPTLGEIAKRIFNLKSALADIKSPADVSLEHLAEVAYALNMRCVMQFEKPMKDENGVELNQDLVACLESATRVEDVGYDGVAVAIFDGEDTRIVSSEANAYLKDQIDPHVHHNS